MPNKKITLNNSSLDDVEIPIFIKNSDGIYIYCNKAFIDFLGISKNKILGHTAYDIAPRKFADIYAAADKALFESASQQRYESNVQTGSSISTQVTFNKSIIYNKNHDIAGFIGTIDSESKITDPKKLLGDLTPRESEVLGLLAKGKPVKTIASMLGISAHTVTHYLKSIYVKLDAHSKNEAIFKALARFTLNE